ncbi:MAG: isochorismatase family protein [Thermodesulfobacteriota bacterium]
MQDKNLLHQALTDADDSVLIVIDVQQTFFEKMPKEQVRPIINRIRWVVQMAVKLNIPIVATAEDIPEEGTNIPQIAGLFPDGTKEHNKMSHGLAGDPDILSAVKKTNRKTAVIVGLETDVCVMQSALGLLQNGFRVVVLSDATASPGPCHDAGIVRMQNAGVIISTVKGTCYEWTRTVDFLKANFHTEFWETEPPEGVYL